MGMQIDVQKISNPSEEWSLDVESSDTIESVKQKMIDQDFPNVYNLAKINLFFNSVELSDSSTLSDYNIQKNSHLTSSYDVSDCDPMFDKWASPPDSMAPPFSNDNPENGCSRYRRLRLLGYI